MRHRRSLPFITILAVSLLLAACSGADDPETDDAGEAPADTTPEAPDEEPDDEEPEGEEPEGEQDPAATEDDPAAAPEDPFAGLPDLSELRQDGVFRGEGIVMPVPADWEFNETAQLQGQVLATNAEGTQQLAGQTVDAAVLGDLDFDTLLAGSREQFPGEASVDEEVTLDGAVRAHQLRYEAIPPEQPDAPEVSMVLVVAEAEDGGLASFNYAAAGDAFDEDRADGLVDTVGFDPDSEPTPPPAPPAPAPTG